MKDFYVADAPRFDNQIVTGYFCLSQVSLREKKSGGQYLALTLGDKTGSFEARMWEEFADPFSTCGEGCYVKVQGKIESYKGAWQITIQKMRNAAESEIEPADFQPVAERAMEEMDAELRGIVTAFRNSDLRRLVLAFLDDPEIGPAFRVAPAAKVLHHAWLHGLLEHVLGLAKMILVLAPFYPEVDPDLAVTGAILHDIGKIRELSWKSAFTYTLEGQLIGHISIAQGMLREKVQALTPFPDRLRVLVEHMILSHHGRLEFGSPKLPMTPEAMLLSAVDDLEAKFAAMRREFRAAETGGKRPGELTEWVRSMERNLFDSQRWIAAEVKTHSAAAPAPSGPGTASTPAASNADLPPAPLVADGDPGELLPRISPGAQLGIVVADTASGINFTPSDRSRSAEVQLKGWVRNAGDRDGPTVSFTADPLTQRDLAFQNGCLGKLRYDSESHAVAYLEHLEHQPELRNNDGTHAYLCGSCGGWHLGH